MLHQAGFTNAIATLGTALTPDHLPQLKKLNAKVLLSYDSDSAGINAALRASKLLFKDFFEGGVILFPQGLDHADVVKKGDDLDKYFNSQIPFLEFIIEYTIKKYDIKNPMQKKKALDELKAYIFTLPEILKESFISKAAQYLQISPKLLNVRHTKNTPLQNKKIEIAEASIIKTLYENPHLMDEIVEYLSIDVFKTHSLELSLVYQEKFDDSKLLDIVLRDDILTLNFESLKKQIIKLLIPYYQNKIIELKTSDLDPTEKMHKLKLLNYKILQLKKGELVESDSTI